jgi:hypothetical protein
MGSFFNTGCTSVYTSQGSGVKQLLTVWRPEDGHNMGMTGTSKYVCVGYYASVDAASPQVRYLYREGCAVISLQ